MRQMKISLMTELLRRFYLSALVLLLYSAGCVTVKHAPSQPNEKYTEQAALRMIRASQGTLAPVYAPLAEQIVTDFNLCEKEGIGIDLGSGPGTLILELCERTRLHWINADINPHFFPHFYSQAQQQGFGHRVSAVFADACSLPFRDNYADIIVSRGSFPFWHDRRSAFGEIYRVLKPGAVAYIGRGFSRNLPVATAKKIRAKQGRSMKYDVDKAADELRHIMEVLQIKEWKIHRPNPLGSDNVSYGLWIEFHKPID
jgi:SAM-dependent methyltransferase